MTRELWLDCLNQFYYECVSFWSREGKNEDDAIRAARADIERINHLPYVPHGPEIPADVKAEFLSTIPEF